MPTWCLHHAIMMPLSCFLKCSFFYKNQRCHYNAIIASSKRHHGIFHWQNIMMTFWWCHDGIIMAPLIFSRFQQSFWRAWVVADCFSDFWDQCTALVDECFCLGVPIVSTVACFSPSKCFLCKFQELCSHVKVCLLGCYSWIIFKWNYKVRSCSFCI